MRIAWLSLLVCSPLAWGQGATTREQRAQAWFVAMAQASGPGRLRVYLELQPRASWAPEGTLRADQLLVRAALGFQVHRTFSVWLGVATVQGEGRWFEQLTWVDAFGPVRLSARLRLEQRWLPGVEGIQHRIRLQVRAAWNFWGPLSVVVYDEPFLNLPFTFDQNRAYLAVGFRAHSKVTLEMGYLNQLLPTRLGHTVVLSAGLGF